MTISPKLLNVLDWTIHTIQFVKIAFNLELRIWDLSAALLGYSTFGHLVQLARCRIRCWKS